jgi:pimeloyl-ACP methyl ester carboxylesterase
LIVGTHATGKRPILRRSIVVLALAGAVLAIRCGDSRSAAVDEKTDATPQIMTTVGGIRFVRTPDERFEHLAGYPFEPHYVDVDGLRMHYVDEGPRDGEVVLLLHGEPSWSYLYRKMIPILAAAGHRVIAPDLIGMGRSDKPVELGAYTYEQEIAWVTQFIDALGLQDITLFCQDWGSLIGLRIVGDHPDRFARVVVANGRLPVIPKGVHLFTVPDPVEIDPSKGDFASFQATLDPSQPQPVNFSKWIEYALTAPDLRPSQVVEYLTVSQLTPEEAAAYDAPFPSLVYKAGIRAFPSMIAAVQDENAPAWAALGRFTKPFLSFAGTLDRNLGSEAVQNELITHIPGAKGQPHERFEANHFIQEDIGDVLADGVNQFIANSPR